MNTDYTELSELVKKLQSGDISAFEKIYNLTYDRVYFTALKICKNEEDAEDIVQESYIYLMNKAEEIKKPDAFLSWFNMVVASKSKNLLRKNNPVLFESNETEQFVLESIEDTDEKFQPSADYEQSELREEVMGLIDNLSDDKRTAVILFYYDEMTTKQIADSLSVNENTIKSRLVQAKKDLAKGIKELEKRNGKLLGVAPISIVLWAMRGSATKAAETFTVSGGAAATYTAIIATTAETAVAAASTAGAATTAGGVIAKIAGFSVTQKIISGVVVAGIVAGGAVGTKAVIAHQKNVDRATTDVVQIVELTGDNTDERQNNGVTSDISSSITSENASLTTKTTVATVVTTTTKSATQMTTNYTSKTAVNTTTTATKTTTTVGKATVNIIVTQSGERRTTKAVTVNAGEMFTFNDAKSYVKAMGYDTSTAMYEGNLPIIAEAGKIYSVIIDVE